MLVFSPPRLAALPDRQATFVLYKLAVNQPSPQWSLFLRVRYSTLTVNILRYTVNIRNATFGDLLCVITAEQVVTERTLFAMDPLLRFLVLRVLNVVGALSNYKRFIINQ